MELMDLNVHIQSLLDIQKGTVADLENSLNQEKNLSHQFQLKLQSSQRTITDLEQRLRVFFSLCCRLGSWRESGYISKTNQRNRRERKRDIQAIGRETEGI